MRETPDFLYETKRGYLLPQADLEKLYKEINKIRKKLGMEQVVDVNIVDRTRFEPDQSLLVPYEHKCQTPEEHEERLDYLITNIQIAIQRAESCLKIRRWNRQSNKKTSII